MHELTEDQWGRLLTALGQVPMVDIAMALNARETEVLGALALRGLDWQMRRVLHLGEGDSADALDLASRLRLDPKTGEKRMALTEYELKEIDDDYAN